MKKGVSLEPEHGGGRERLISTKHEETVRQIRNEKPDVTLNEIRRQLKKHTGLSVSEPTMSRTMRRLGLTHKRKSVEASERGRPDVQEKRSKYRLRAAIWDPRRLVFIDETGVNLAMTRRYGSAPIGDRVVGDAPYHRGDCATLVAALTVDGLKAPFLFPGAMNTQALRAYADSVLSPCLRHGDIVLWDNLSVHGDPTAAALIEQAGARLEFIPPYSRLQSHRARLVESERTATPADRAYLEATHPRRHSEAVRAVTPEDRQAWVKHCGYLLICP